MTGVPGWAQGVRRKFARIRRGSKFEAREAVALLAAAKVGLKSRKDELPEQPFDRQLLMLSPLFRRSRGLYLEGGGRFRGTLASSPRTLSSPILLEQLIEFSPIERELVWAATDKRQRRDPAHLFAIRTYCSSLFHEQNHRILWRFLPPAPRGQAALRRYLNFAESLVIAADMALGDSLGGILARMFYLVGVTYDPGTELRSERKFSRRHYRNYLQAAMYGTYLNLELYDPRRIPGAITALFPALGDLAGRAALRSGNLDRAFIIRTNAVWQTRFSNQVRSTLAKAGPGLVLSGDPMDNRLQYLLAEKWFDLIGL